MGAPCLLLGDYPFQEGMDFLDAAARLDVAVGLEAVDESLVDRHGVSAEDLQHHHSGGIGAKAKLAEVAPHVAFGHFLDVIQHDVVAAVEDRVEDRGGFLGLSAGVGKVASESVDYILDRRDAELVEVHELLFQGLQGLGGLPGRVGCQYGVDHRADGIGIRRRNGGGLVDAGKELLDLPLVLGCVLHDRWSWLVLSGGGVCSLSPAWVPPASWPAWRAA